MGDLSLSSVEFKALSSESRTRILKLLAERNYTLSELSAKTEMAAPTIKQHATILVESGLIELRDEGRKWKYYALTRKGKDVLGAQKPQQANILLILSSTVIVAMLGFAILSSNMGLYSPSAVPTSMGASQEITMDSLAKMPPRTGESSTSAMNVDTARCEPNFEVEYATAPNQGISASEYYAQNCYINTTEQKCLEQDFYNEEAQRFGESDGKPDCAWFEPTQR